MKCLLLSLRMIFSWLFPFQNFTQVQKVKNKVHALKQINGWTVTHIQTTQHYSAPQRNGLSRHEKTWKKLKRMLLSKSSHVTNAKRMLLMWKPYMLYNSSHLTCWRKNYLGSKRPVVARGWGQEGWTGRAYMIPSWWIHVIIHLSTSAKCMIELLNISCGLSVIIMCQCKFINCDEWVTLVGDTLTMG